MKHIPTLTRLLLGLIFTVFGANMWLHFIPVPPPPEGPLRASCSPSSAAATSPW